MSSTRSTSNGWPPITALKLSCRSRCQPGFRLATQVGSVGLLPRRSTEDGVRWKT